MLATGCSGLACCRDAGHNNRRRPRRAFARRNRSAHPEHTRQPQQHVDACTLLTWGHTHDLGLANLRRAAMKRRGIHAERAVARDVWHSSQTAFHLQQMVTHGLMPRCAEGSHRRGRNEQRTLKFGAGFAAGRVVFIQRIERERGGCSENSHDVCARLETARAILAAIVRGRSHAAGVARPARDQRPAEHRHARAHDRLARFICHASTHGRVLPHENAQIDGTLAIAQLQRAPPPRGTGLPRLPVT